MKKTYWIHAVTPLHIGAGKGLGYIDMPIAREKVTNWPIIPASAVKGVLRAGCEDKKKDCAFGTSGDAGTAGSIVFTDARLICLPVRSIYGTFAWCCSPISLSRLKRDLEMAGFNNLPPLPSVNNSAVIICSQSRLKDGTTIYLEDLDLTAESASQNNNVDNWAKLIATSAFDSDEESVRFCERFAVLSDDVFSFLCETGTEVMAHIKIDDDKKTAQDGALWYEESLPAETLMSGLIWCDRVYGGGTPKDLVNAICPSDKAMLLQLGGKGTVGKGQALCRFRDGGNN